MGGLSAEREVSLNTGAGVLAALHEKGWDAVAIDWSEGTSLPRLLDDAGAQVVWNALHGTYGEDGAVQGLCACLRLPCTGSGILASALAMDKVMSKRIFESQRRADAALAPVAARRSRRRQRRVRALADLAAAVRRQARERGQLGRRQRSSRIARSSPPAVAAARKLPRPGDRRGLHRRHRGVRRHPRRPRARLGRGPARRRSSTTTRRSTSAPTRST